MSKGNLQTAAQGGKNMPYQFATVQLLGQIVAGLAPVPGLATEATLLQVLAALQNGQEFEQSMVIDLGGVGCPANCPTYLEIRVWNTTTHTFDPPVYYNAAGAVVVPVGPLEYVNPLFVLENILTQITAINADLDVALSTRASEATLAAINGKIVQLALNYGVATGALRTAAQIGNATGAADFGAGTVSAQTLRTTLVSDVALPAGENHLGSMGGNTGYVEVTMTLDTVGYAAGDVLTNTVNITNLLRVSGGTGIIQSIHVLDEDHQGQAIDVVFFRSNVSLGPLNGPVTLSVADAREILGVVNVTTSDWVDLVNTYSATKTGLSIGTKGDASADIFMSMICRSGTPTYTANGITVKVVMLQD